MFLMTMFRVFSAVVLVCVCSVCVCERAERADLPRDFGVKLCGREFIRAVIFTCGGSRWRRSDIPHSHWLLDSYLDRDAAPGPDEGVPLFSSLTELLRVAQTAADGETSANWPRPDRSKRNFSLGLAGMCCNQGCTKNDIGRLC
ncbi:prorelaxin H1 [Megalobrama amblycephala]|uniref:prorelaxin H1 n=1 Tax=Megalobrama amblycephala TaxID=75352 RepID=UPI0020145F9C|nr:prorelaxin H1 [Megalobrama amblycephala]